MGIFSDLFSTKPAENAANDKIAGINTGLTTANSTLDTGQAGADALYGQAYAPYSSLIDSTGKGSQAYADATGVNGADGIARGGSTFKSLPGYSGGLTTGIDAVNRGAAARGLLGSGQTSADEIKFASDYDANKYGNYVSSLAPYLGANANAISGAAGVKSAQAGADLGVAGTKANLDYSANTAIGGANADKDLAPYSASQNFWSALMGGANLLGKATGVGGFAPSAANSNIVLGGASGPGQFRTA